VIDGKKVTSWPTLETDLKNAGASWEDSEVVKDSNIITSRNPDDLPAFCKKIIETES
jgi:protease I